jgi:hypothetical protein
MLCSRTGLYLLIARARESAADANKTKSDREHVAHDK